MHGSEVSGKVCLMQGCVVHRSPWKHWPGYVSPRRMACLWRPVFGVSGFCSREVLVNQVIKHRQVKQRVAALRVTLLPTLLMPETKKNPELADTSEKGTKDVLHPCSLPHSCHAFVSPAATARFPCRSPTIQSSLLPRPGAAWLPAPGCRFCLCWWNDLSQPFQSEYLHTVLLRAMYMVHICLEEALLCNAETCPQRHKELTQCNFPNKTKGSASLFS